MEVKKKNTTCGLTVLDVALIIAILTILVLIAAPNFKSRRKRADSRACYANMKTIAGALELYNLDHEADCVLEGFHVPEKTEITYLFLKERGYLRSIPIHPGTREHTAKVYHVDDNGIMYCKSQTPDFKNHIHGYIKRPDKVTIKVIPKEQLKQWLPTGR